MGEVHSLLSDQKLQTAKDGQHKPQEGVGIFPLHVRAGTARKQKLNFPPLTVAAHRPQQPEHEQQQSGTPCSSSAVSCVWGCCVVHDMQPAGLSVLRCEPS
mgnify:CR=1 FL=1